MPHSMHLTTVPSGAASIVAPTMPSTVPTTQFTVTVTLLKSFVDVSGIFVGVPVARTALWHTISMALKHGLPPAVPSSVGWKTAIPQT